VPGSGTDDALNEPDTLLTSRVLPAVTSAAVHAPLGQKNRRICSGVMFGIVEENPPVQSEDPAPSVANPDMPILTTVSVPIRVKTTGDVLPATLIEHDCPVLTTAAQFVFEDPGDTPVKKYCKFGCNSNWRNGLKTPAPAGGGDPNGWPPLIRTPSVVTSGPPAKTRVVAEFTSAFQGGPGTGNADGSGVQFRLVRVASTNPDEPNPRIPIGDANALPEARNNINAVVLSLFIFVISSGINIVECRAYER